MIDLKPQHIEAAYSLLRTLYPFDGYNLPEADEVEFRVVKDKRLLGWHHQRTNADRTNVISISYRGVGHLDSLMRVLGHELIHLAQAVNGTSTKSLHNAEFYRMAEEVCDSLGWDIRIFA